MLGSGTEPPHMSVSLQVSEVDSLGELQSPNPGPPLPGTAVMTINSAPPYTPACQLLFAPPPPGAP